MLSGPWWPPDPSVDYTGNDKTGESMLVGATELWGSQRRPTLSLEGHRRPLTGGSS